MAERTTSAKGSAARPRCAVLAHEEVVAAGVLLAGLALRVTTLSGALAEVHGWRQADVAMIAGNFYRGGFDILYPRVNWAGSAPGYVGTEFPLVPALAAVLYMVFGERLLLGRLISLGAFLAGAWIFYLLTRKYLGWAPALWALFLYVFSPLTTYYSRTFMPDSTMLFFSVGAVWAFDRWISTASRRAYTLSLLLAALALLVKIPAAIIAFPMAYLAWQKWGWTTLRRPGLWMFAALAVAPSLLWYTHALALARANYPFHMFGEGGWIWSTGLKALLDASFLRPIIIALVLSVLPPLTIAFAGVGAVLAPRQGVTRLFHWWALGFLVFLVLALPGARHEYYHLPFVPAAAALAGWGAWCLTRISRGRVRSPSKPARAMVALAVAGIMLGSYLGLMLRMQSQTNRVLHEAGSFAAAVLPGGTLIVAADWGNPVLIQASGLRGWHFPVGERFGSPAAWAPGALETLRGQGAQFFVAPVRTAGSHGNPTFLQRVAARLDPPRPAEYLQDHRELELYLRARYRQAAAGKVAVIYDLRTPISP